jgi:hypothetical protein
MTTYTITTARFGKGWKAQAYVDGVNVWEFAETEEEAKRRLRATLDAPKVAPQGWL